MHGPLDPARPPLRCLSGPYTRDTGIALVVAALVMLPWLRRPADAPAIGTLGVVLNAGTVLPLVWRRRAPYAVAWIVLCFGAAVGGYHRPGQNMQYGVVVAVYTVVTLVRPAQRRIFGGLLVVWLAVGAVVKGNSLPEVLLLVSILISTWVLGTLSRTRRAYTSALEERARRLEHERRLETARAVTAERAKIARDMHDILSHAVSLMVVQAEAGPVVVRSDPERAVRVFDTIAGSGRDAMEQLRRMLGVLKEEDTAGPRGPQPTVAALPDLIAQVERTGLPVELRVEGDSRPLPPDAEVAAYRIVQEALTNTLKHAAATLAVVRLRWTPEALTITVGDDGRASPVPGGGNGLIGIRERAAAFGGTAETGPRPGGDGYEVTARLPVREGAR